MSNNNTNNQTENPMRHYTAVYRELDPQEISRRCNLEFDNEKSAFSLRILGTEYLATYPEFALIVPEALSDGKESSEPCSMEPCPADPYEKILIIRYLCEGKFFPPQGRRLSYNEFPWGEVYYRNFEGRCLKHCAFIFGSDIPKLKKTIEENPQLRAEPLELGDASWRLEFLNGLYITLILWGPDDEFPPSAQILFDDNFIFAFTAEDLAAVGDILIERLQGLMLK
jgi:hypothetical protein